MTATRLGSFIQHNIDAILSEWERFARTRIPAAATMSVLDLRDHAEETLRAIADGGAPSTALLITWPRALTWRLSRLPNRPRYARTREPEVGTDCAC